MGVMMRVILDTNILISALIVPDSPPHRIYEAWRAGAFVLLTSDQQLEEFRRVTRYDKLRRYIDPATAGTLHNELRKLAQSAGRSMKVRRSPDSADDYLLALAQAADADYLVTGDKSGLLALKRHGRTRIVTARRFSGVIAPRSRKSRRGR